MTITTRRLMAVLCVAGLLTIWVSCARVLSLLRPPADVREDQLQDGQQTTHGTSLFQSGKKIRTYDGARLSRQEPPIGSTAAMTPSVRTPKIISKQPRPQPQQQRDASKSCSKVAVAFLPKLPAVLPTQLGGYPSWCLVVVLDDGEQPTDQNKLQQDGTKNEGIFWVTANPHDTHLRVSHRHIANKNHGYLYAIQTLEAQFLLDVHYDAVDHSTLNLQNVVEDAIHAVETTYFVGAELGGATTWTVDVPLMGNRKVFNPHSILFNDTDALAGSWPRGYPVANIYQHPQLHPKVAHTKDLPHQQVAVVQHISPTSPDLDAQGHMLLSSALQQLKQQQQPAPPVQQPKGTRRNPVMVPRHAVSPYNALSTLHTPNTLWAAWLPHTVHSRVADIWRSYAAQALFRDLDLRVVYATSGPGSSPPFVSDDNNNDDEAVLQQNLQGDFVFYSQASHLVDVVQQLRRSLQQQRTVPARMEALWVDLYERGFVERDDVLSLQQWIAALTQSTTFRYEFPKLQPTASRPYYNNVVLMGQFNFPDYQEYTNLNTTEDPSLWEKANEKNAFWNENNEKILVTTIDMADMAVFWVQKWREVFEHVVIRGPFREEQLRVFRAHYGIRAFGMSGGRNITAFDHGYFSPYENLARTLLDYQDDPSIQGVVYLHDDLLLNLTEITHSQPLAFPSEEIIGSGQGSRPSFVDPRTVLDKEMISHRSYYIYRDGTFLKPNGQRLGDNQTILIDTLEKWPWNPLCVSGLVGVAQDARIDPYREKSTDKGASSILVSPQEPSDFLFVPTRYAREFAAIANVFLEHQVFLECAVPTIVDMVRRSQQPEASVTTRNLCTNWNETFRNTEKMVTLCLSELEERSYVGSPSPFQYGLFHPYKLSLGLEAWDVMFDFVTYSPHGSP